MSKIGKIVPTKTHQINNATKTRKKLNSLKEITPECYPNNDAQSTKIAVTITVTSVY